jgi:hypothetical protein
MNAKFLDTCEDICELAAWGLDEGVERGPISSAESTFENARRKLRRRETYQPECPLLEEETNTLAPLLARHHSRVALNRDCRGLDWKLAVIDLRKLLAFQRRVSVERDDGLRLQDGENWEQLISLAFPERKADFTFSINPDGSDAVIRSTNPDLKLVIDSPLPAGRLSLPLLIDLGSPFIEAANYNGRWFLRDGYHRAYSLLKIGIHRVPAVVISARTIEELGAVHPWFFDRTVLFSERPPRLVDFHDRELVLRYRRPMREKLIRVSVEESFQPYQGAEL